MEKNVKIAKELLKLAKSLIASNKGTCKIWEKSKGDFFEGHCILHFEDSNDTASKEDYLKEVVKKIEKIGFDRVNYYYEESDDTYRIGYFFEEEQFFDIDDIASIFEHDGWQVQTNA